MPRIKLIDRTTDIYIQSVGNTEITIYGPIQEMKNQLVRIWFNSMESLYVGE